MSDKTIQAMINREYVYSDLFQENFKLVHDNKDVQKVVFSKGAVYSLKEIQVIKDVTPEKLKEIHDIKTVFGGSIKTVNDKKV